MEGVPLFSASLLFFFPKSLSCSTLLSKSYCLLMRQPWQHPQGLQCLFGDLGCRPSSLRLLLLDQRGDSEACYLFSICICRLSDVKLARRSVTSSTCQKNTVGHQAQNTAAHHHRRNAHAARTTLPPGRPAMPKLSVCYNSSWFHNYAQKSPNLRQKELLPLPKENDARTLTQAIQPALK